MRRIREVLRLRYSVGLHQEQIARSCSIGQATVHRYLERAAAVGLKWPLAEDLDDQQLDALLFPTRPARPVRPQLADLDFQRVRQQLQTHKHLTLQLLWEEYREACPQGYSYSRYVAAEFMLRTESSRRIGALSAAFCSNIIGRLLSATDLSGRPSTKATEYVAASFEASP